MPTAVKAATKARSRKRPNKRLTTPGSKRPERPAPPDVAEVLAWLQRKGTKATREGMARYAIPSDTAFGVTVGNLRQYAKQIGRSHDLAAALWATGRYEARMLATFVDEPAQVTPAQMDRWSRAFDSWAICDSACFHLFDRTPHAWAKIDQWADHRDEFVKRAAFALLASLSVHDKAAEDGLFLSSLPLIERAATDERNFVKKAVNWALRSLGKRSPALNEAAVILAHKLSESPDAAARWVGKDALRELTNAAVQRHLTKRRPAKTIS